MDHVQTEDLFETARPSLGERCFAVGAPAALAAGLGSLAGPQAAALAGAVGGVVGVCVVAICERFSYRVRTAAVKSEFRMREQAREDVRLQLENVVSGAAHAAAEYERRATFADDARRAQNQMLAELAPEFYGLLRSIGHHAEQLTSAELDQEDREAAAALSASSGSLRRLLGGVLDLARARAGRMRLRERDFDLFATLDRLSKSFEQAARRKGLEFHLTVGGIGNHWRFGDERRVQQMLERMLGAALDMTERGSIELVVSEDPDNAGRLRFQLSDGAAIHDQAAFDRLLTDSPSGFESLFELDASLSLALARGLAEVMGGDLTAEARKEGGHDIAVELPLAAGDDPHSDGSGAGTDGIGLRAIVAAPAGPLGDLAASTAAGMGWIVERASDRASAELAFAEGAADVFVVSSSFDGGCGIERLADWNSEWPASASLLLLDPSSVIDPRALAHCGAGRCIAGPPHPARLREALAALVEPVENQAPSTRALLASDDEEVAVAESRRLHAQGMVVDRVRSAEELLDAFQDAVYGLVVVDQGSIDAPVKSLSARLREMHGLSGGPFKFHVLMSGKGSGTGTAVSAQPALHDTDASLSLSSAPIVNPDETQRAIDPDVIAELRRIVGEDEPGLVAELIGIFLDEAPARLKDLSDAALSNDLTGVERAAHSLKSSSGNLGAVILATLCREIEESCHEGAVDDVRSLVERSHSEFERVRAALALELG